MKLRRKRYWRNSQNHCLAFRFWTRQQEKFRKLLRTKNRRRNTKKARTACLLCLRVCLPRSELPKKRKKIRKVIQALTVMVSRQGIRRKNGNLNLKWSLLMSLMSTLSSNLMAPTSGCSQQPAATSPKISATPKLFKTDKSSVFQIYKH